MVALALGQVVLVFGLLAAVGFLLFTDWSPRSSQAESAASPIVARVAPKQPLPRPPAPPAVQADGPVDLPMPEPVSHSTPELTWHDGTDPLWVRNIDVVDPKRREYIDQLSVGWGIDRITEIRDEDDKVVLEVWFKGYRRPFREGDRLPNTRFVIKRIFKDRVYKSEDGTQMSLRSGVEFESDTGATWTIFLDEKH